MSPVRFAFALVAGFAAASVLGAVLALYAPVSVEPPPHQVSVGPGAVTGR